MLESKTCLNDNQLLDYLGGWSKPAQQELFDQHLSDCSECQEKLATLEAESSDRLSPLQDLVGQRMQWNPKLLQDQGSSDRRLDEDSLVNQALLDLQQGPPSFDETSPRTMPETIGQYQLIRSIGCGGMAEVYLAQHDKLKRPVAIKILHVNPAYRHEALRRLEREIEVVGQLNHPAIVAATDAGEFQGQPYLVTEFIDGLDLSQLAMRLRRNSEAISTADACELIRQAALGMDYAHSQTVVHRDLKPSNLMLDGNGRIRILDFGLGHWVGQQNISPELTSVGQLLGTLDYMSPEQADDANRTDHRSDIYSLGATLFRLLTTRAPYAVSGRQSPLEKLRLLATQDPVHLATLRPDLPAELCQTVDNCLSRNPEQRPASAAHLAEALAPFCQDANLIALIEKAQQLPAVTPSVPRTHASQAAGTHVSVAKTVDLGFLGRWGFRIATAAFGFGFLLLSILLTLETQKGHLIIRSDQANVTVKLLKDGQSYKDWQLKPGDNQTTLYAGNYEIQIEGETNQIHLDQNRIELRRGEVVIATVENKNTNITSDATEAQTLATNSSTIIHDAPFDSKKLLSILTSYHDNEPEVKLGSSEKGIIQQGSDASQEETATLLKYIASPDKPQLNLKHGTFAVMPQPPVGPSLDEITTAIEFTGIDTGNFQAGKIDNRWVMYGKRKEMDLLLAKMNEMEFVTQLPTDNAASTQTETLPDQPIYQGKTFDYWLAIFLHEQEINHQLEALEAIVKLRSEETEAKISKALVDRIINGDLDTLLSSSGSPTRASVLYSHLSRARLLPIQTEDRQRLIEYSKTLSFKKARLFTGDFRRLSRAPDSNDQSWNEIAIQLTTDALKLATQDNTKSIFDTLGQLPIAELTESQLKQLSELSVFTDEFLIENFDRLRDYQFLHDKALAAAFDFLPPVLSEWKDEHGFLLSKMIYSVPENPRSANWRILVERLDKALTTLDKNVYITYPTPSETERQIAGMLGRSGSRGGYPGAGGSSDFMIGSYGRSSGGGMSGSRSDMSSSLSSGSSIGSKGPKSFIPALWQSADEKKLRVQLIYNQEKIPVSMAVLDFIRNATELSSGQKLPGVKHISQKSQPIFDKVWPSILQNIDDAETSAILDIKGPTEMDILHRGKKQPPTEMILDTHSVILNLLSNQILDSRTNRRD